MADESNKLFDNGSKNATESSLNSKKKGKFLGKVKDTLTGNGVAKGLYNDTVTDSLTSVKNAASDISSSFLDSLKPKSLRKDRSDTFKSESVSFENLHTGSTEVQSILNNTFTGNLFDAGVSTINLVRYGQKYTIYTDTYVDKDSYSFRYTNFNIGGVSDNPIEDDASFSSFLDSIEDPIQLGFTARINFETSPIFAGTLETQPSDYSALSFINLYKPQHRELEYATSYLDAFAQDIKKLFDPPSFHGRNYSSVRKKNHYIKNISGLNKLDDEFVKFDPEKPVYLEFTLEDDTKMFSPRLGFLYRQLVWSHNSGKKLIPENLLRFNLYIKISDIKNYTSGDERTREKYENGFSRFIYELKECEFVFDDSTLPESLTSDNDKLSEYKFKVKYRKVNRLFYSEMYGLNPMYAGNKFYVPSLENNKAMLSESGFGKSYTKAENINNNIKVEESLDTKLKNIEQNGLLTSGREDDSAVGGFIKSVGDNFAKKGASLVSEGLQDVKEGLKDTVNKKFSKSELFNNNLSGDNALKNLNSILGTVEEKTAVLGTVHQPSDYTVPVPKKDSVNKRDDSIVRPPQSTENKEDNNIHPPSNKVDKVDSDIDSPTASVHSSVISDIPVPEGEDDVVGSAIQNPDSTDEIDTNIIQPPQNNLGGEGSDITAPDYNIGGDPTPAEELGFINLHDISEFSVAEPLSTEYNEDNDILQPSQTLPTADDIITEPVSDTDISDYDIQDPPEKDDMFTKFIVRKPPQNPRVEDNE